MPSAADVHKRACGKIELRGDEHCKELRGKEHSKELE